MRINRPILCGLTLVNITTMSPAQFIEPDIEFIYSVGGQQSNEKFSLSPATVDDLNGDDIPEIVCTAPGRLNTTGTISACILLDGATGGVIREHATPNSTINYQRTSAAGDMNADGVQDYAVAGWTNSIPGTVHVYSGTDGALLHTFAGQTNGAMFGLGLSSLDDVNNDGHDDLLVGAPFHNPGDGRRGRIIVYSGIDGSVLWSHTGDSPHAALGQSCFSIDDLNGDGIRDVAGTSPQMRPNFFNTGPGFVQLYSGSDGTTIGTPILSPSTTSIDFGAWIPSPNIDLNNDGVSEIIIADQFDTALGTQTGKAFIFDGATQAILHELVGSGSFQGLGATANAGDLDSDGIDDLVVTSWRSPDGAAGLTGKLEILSGSDFTSLGTITSTNPNANFGGWVLSMGDVNADYRPDFFVNAPAYSGDSPAQGRCWIVSGQNFVQCLPDLNNDANLDFFDISAFLIAYTKEDPIADFTGDTLFDFFDISAFLTAYSQGCP